MIFAAVISPAGHQKIDSMADLLNFPDVSNIRNANDL
jgi:hypothetical protein